MWTFAAQIPDGYLIAGLAFVGTVTCGVGSWIFRSMSSTDRRTTVLEQHDQSHTLELADHEDRLRALERRR